MSHKITLSISNKNVDTDSADNDNEKFEDQLIVMTVLHAKHEINHPYW